MIRVEVTFEGKLELHRFFRKQITVGRAADNDLVLDHPSVAERHLQVVPRGEGFVVSDAGAAEGTTINGAPLVNVASAHHRDVIRVGAYHLQLIETPMGGDAPFIEALEKDPADDDTRAVYADWLEEHHRPREAEFVRAQLAVLDLPADDPAFKKHAETISELAFYLPFWWRRVVSRPPIENCAVRFELPCPSRWSHLARTETPDVRHCATCDKHVHYASTVEAARRLAILGECVAVDTIQGRFPGDLDEDDDDDVTAGMVVQPYDDDD